MARTRCRVIHDGGVPSCAKRDKGPACLPAHFSFIADKNPTLNGVLEQLSGQLTDILAGAEKQGTEFDRTLRIVELEDVQTDDFTLNLAWVHTDSCAGLKVPK
jgi:hypothetical protein